MPVRALMYFGALELLIHRLRVAQNSLQS